VGEAERLLAVADTYVKDFFTAMIATGCRPGELRRLQWSEVKDHHLVLLASKTKDREERRLPILRELRAILDRRKVGPDGSDFGPDAFVFGDAFGNELQKRRLCQRWLDVCRKAGVENLHLHDLRAEAGSQLLEAGVPIHAVRDVLGHSSTSTTNTYLRTRQRSIDDAFAKRQRALLRVASGSR